MHPTFGQTAGLHNLYGGFVGGARYWSGTTGPLEITSGPTVAGLPGRPFTAALQASGGTGSYIWSLTGGALPTGLTLTPSGVITGTPRRPGSVPISVQVSDGSSTQTASFVLRVGATHEELYARASDAGIWHNYFDPTNGWSGWYSMGTPNAGTLSSDVSVGFNGLGNEELFSVAGDGTVWHDYFDPTNDWSGWYPMGGPTGAALASGVTVGYNGPGNEELLARATDGTVWHDYFDPTNGWSGWYPMGGPSGAKLVSNIAVGNNSAGSEELFARAADGSVWHDYFDPTYGWSGWYPMGGSSGATLASDITVGYNGAGNEELFARATDGTVWHDYFDSTNGWSGWYSMGGPSGGTLDSAVTVGYNAGGNEELFVRATDGTVWHNYFDPTNGWSGWYSMGGSSGAPLASDVSASETNFPLSPPGEAAPAAGTSAIKGGDSKPGKERRRLRCTVPRLSHMRLSRAKRALRKAHCSLGHVSRPKHGHRGNKLRVSGQSSRAGSHYRKGYPVGVFLS